MNASLRRSATVALALALAGLFPGCFGRARDGSDSETHFACTTDHQCIVHAHELRCIEGYCRSSEPPGASMPVMAPSTDAGPVTAPTPPAAGPWGKPLAKAVTISGTILFGKDIVPPFDDIQVALVWDEMLDVSMDPECSGDPARTHLGVVQPAEASISGAEFTMRITETPPYDAFPHPSPEAGGANWTRGAVFAYRDGDHDGHLTFATPSVSSPDLVIATSSPVDMDPSIEYPATRETYRITYSDLRVESQPPPFGPGYGISYWRDYETTLGEERAIDTRISMLIGQTRELVCKKVCFSATGPACPARVADAMALGNGECRASADGSEATYVVLGTTCDGCRCVPRECAYTQEMNGREAEWPCGKDGGS